MKEGRCGDRGPGKGKCAGRPNTYALGALRVAGEGCRGWAAAHGFGLFQGSAYDVARGRSSWGESEHPGRKQRAAGFIASRRRRLSQIGSGSFEKGKQEKRGRMARVINRANGAWRRQAPLWPCPRVLCVRLRACTAHKRPLRTLMAPARRKKNTGVGINGLSWELRACCEVVRGMKNM